MRQAITILSLVAALTAPGWVRAQEGVAPLPAGQPATPTPPTAQPTAAPATLPANPLSNTVVVRPFQVSGIASPDWMGKAISASLEKQCKELGLQVVDDSPASAPATPAPGANPLQALADRSVGYLIEGSCSLTDDKMVLAGVLVDVGSGLVMRDLRAEGSPADFLALDEQIGGQVRQAISARTAPHIAQAPTPAPSPQQPVPALPDYEAQQPAQPYYDDGGAYPPAATYTDPGYDYTPYSDYSYSYGGAIIGSYSYPYAYRPYYYPYGHRDYDRDHHDGRGDRDWRGGDRDWRGGDRDWRGGDRDWRGGDRDWRGGDRDWHSGDRGGRDGRPDPGRRDHVVTDRPSLQQRAAIAAQAAQEAQATLRQRRDAIPDVRRSAPSIGSSRSEMRAPAAARPSFQRSAPVPRSDPGPRSAPSRGGGQPARSGRR